MRVIGYLFLVSAFFANCGTLHSETLEDHAQILYYDRNGDGEVDLEKHQHPGFTDADWELRDDDYDGKYEKKIHFGLAVLSSVIDIRVPTGVKIGKTLKPNPAVKRDAPPKSAAPRPLPLR